MKIYSKEDIDNARFHFQEQGYHEINASLGKEALKFFVLPQSLNQDLPDFAFRATGIPEDGYVLGVSDSIKITFRPYVAYHEFLEFIRIGINTPNRCVTALIKELDILPKTEKHEYLVMRKKFFSNLVNYAQQRPEIFTEKDIREFAHSLKLLENLLPSRS
jgi:hypothetical protein